jgi:hypothetical protein
MGFKPDYGLRRSRDGISPTSDLFFYNFQMFSLTVLGCGEYSTVSDTQYAGQWHCLSLDFNQAHLERILAKADQQLATHLRTELSRDPLSARSIEFKGHVEFGERARLGQLQTGRYEQFVPLIAQEIF